MDKYLGKKLDGRYEIVELIGIGGMANVYKAYDVSEEQVVAVKILREEYMDNEDMRRRFKNESKAMAVLSHPNVMRVYDVSFSDRMQSIVMEFIDGITLKEYIEQQKALSWKEALHFTVQILRALQHAHDKGIVHRDIKPQNIMLLSDGTIKITDFGIARFARSETRTLTDKAIGSVHYISPEQASGDNTDARTDIYSVGVILYEMLTGQVPFEADSPVSVALKQIQNTATPPCEINDSIPEGLQDITMHAMEKDLGKRYQSAAQMLWDIDQFKRNPSISFEYKYMAADSPKEKNKYSDAIRSARTGGDDMNGDKKKKKRASKRAPIIPVLAGVTAAFVIVSAAFIGWMIHLNNPFASVEEVSAPKLVGQKYDEIKMSQVFERFTIVQVEGDSQNNEYAKGVIYKQDPEQGKSIRLNSQIRVWVSGGHESLTLPDFTGKDVAEAIAQLQELGIQWDEKQVFDDNVMVGGVIKTIPAANSEVSANEIISIYVSMGPEEKLVTVPDLYSIKLEDARTLLAGLKLRIGKVTYVPDADEDLAEGTIISQSVNADSMVSPNTQIDVEVAGRNQNAGEVALKVNLNLPNLDREVVMTALQDGAEVQRETINPAQAGVWSPQFTGEGVSSVSIYIDGSLYMLLEVDFDRRGHRILNEYPEDFE